MFNNNIQIGTLDITLDNISGLENDKEFKLNGSINVGLSVNSQILNKFELLLESMVRFGQSKIVGKGKVQRELDEVELLRLKVEKARLLKQLRDLNK